MPHIEAVCIVHEVLSDAGRIGQTAIDKRPQAQAIAVGPEGLAGDFSCAKEVHGGVDRAVYAFAAEDSAEWAAELGRELPPGAFGENLRTRGVDVSGAVLGQKWRIGTQVILEVCAPRIPCSTFQRFLDEPHWVKRFTERGAPGAYLRVVVTGHIAAGDAIEILPPPAHGVSIAESFHRWTPEGAARLLANPEMVLAETVRTDAEQALARG